MPLYEYQCAACDKRFEVIQKFSDSSVEICKLCGKGPVRRLQSSPAIQFKGSGWYITDYAKKGASEKASPGSDGKAADAKPETKSDGTTKTESAKSDSPGPTPSTGTVTKE